MIPYSILNRVHGEDLNTSLKYNNQGCPSFFMYPQYSFNFLYGRYTRNAIGIHRQVIGMYDISLMFNKKQYSTISLNSSAIRNTLNIRPKSTLVCNTNEVGQYQLAQGSHIDQEEISWKNNCLLGGYLAGLIEGDGSISVPLSTKNYKRKEYSRIEIAFDIKDLKLMSKISETLGGGYIFIRANGQSGNLVIKDKITLFESVDSINGRMRTPKIEALHRLIVWYNTKHKTTIPLLSLDSIPLRESSWLSGMLEADANFYVDWKLNNNELPIGLTYYLRISQKQKYISRRDSTINESNLPFMSVRAKGSVILD